MNEMIRICIGTEPMQLIPGRVLEHSILARTDQKIGFWNSWNPTDGWDRLFKKYPKKPYRIRGTEFSTWRWLVPELFGREGRAIYLDADQLVFEDIQELWESVPDDKAISAVIGAIGEFNRRPLDSHTVETSVMAMNLERCRWDILKDLFEPVRDGVMRERCRSVGGVNPNPAKNDYTAMMQAAWLPKSEIEPLDKNWNYFNDYVHGQTKLLHFSHVASQPYRNPNHKNSAIFKKELWSAIKSGYLDERTLTSEISKRHIHPAYAKRNR